MALIGNRSVLLKSPARFISGSTSPAPSQLRSNFNRSGVSKNKFISIPKNASVPMGYEPPGSWEIARTGGGLSSFVQVRGGSTISASPLNVRLTAADLAGIGTVSSAALSQLIQMAADLNGQGLITDAELAAVSSLAAALSGSGSASGSVSALIPVAAALSGLGAIVANLKGTGSLAADITPFTDLSPENLAAQLFDSNDIESGVTMRETLRLVLSAVAGKLSGAETSTVAIRDVNDSKNRIIATVDGNGNRTAVTYDVSD